MSKVEMDPWQRSAGGINRGIRKLKMLVCCLGVDENANKALHDSIIISDNNISPARFLLKIVNMLEV